MRAVSNLKIGWIIGNQLEEARFFHSINYNIGGISLVRYNWIAAQINSNPEFRLKYEIYRPWKKYDALIFLKSMGEKNLALLEKYHRINRAVIFDANVNYYTIWGNEYYQGMMPTEKQKEDAINITEKVDGVIADSEFIKSICDTYNSKVCWIPDNVQLDLVPPYRPWKFTGGRLPLLWSGEAIKLFELLVIEDLLKEYAKKIELILITNDLSALERWYPGYKDRFQSLMRAVPHRIIPYQSIEQLLQIYSQGGVVISPRFLDNSYNMGHTEWKITLGMACGRMVFCSPVPSYVKVSELSAGQGIRICQTPEDWGNTLEAILSGTMDKKREEMAAKSVVEQFFSTPVVAKKHAEFVHSIISG